MKQRPNLWLSIGGGISALLFSAYLLLYFDLYRLLGDTADKLIYIPLLLLLFFFLFSLGRLFAHSRDFTFRLLWPVVVTLIAAFLAFFLSGMLEDKQRNAIFEGHRQEMTQIVNDYLSGALSLEEGVNELPAPYEDIVPSHEMILYKTSGQNAYFFLMINHSNRLEGFMYIPEGTLRYEISQQYEGDPYSDTLDDKWIYVVFYK